MERSAVPPQSSTASYTSALQEQPQELSTLFAPLTGINYGAILQGQGKAAIRTPHPLLSMVYVFIGSSDGFLYALEASSGVKKWSFQTAGKVSSSPAVLQGVVYVGSEDGQVYALSDTTGEKVWEYPVGSPVFSSPSIADGVAYIGAYGSSMVLALDASNGSLIWDYQSGMVFASPSIANGVVYIGTYDNNLYAFGTPDTTSPSIQYALTTTVIGEGSVSRSPDKPLYDSDESVQITAIPSADYDFTGWEGDQLGTINPVTITMTQNKTITATFTKKQSTNTSIITSKIQNGTIIASSRITIDCQNQKTNTTSYEIKVDEGTWISLGTSTSYTASGLSLGEHNIEVRSINENGAVVGSEKVNFEVSVWVPPADKAIASSVVIVSTLGAISIIATAISNPLSMPFTWLWEKINALLPDSVKGWLESFISSKRQLVIEPKQGSIFILSRIEVFAYLASLAVMTFAFAYSGAGSFDDFILLIPTVLATSVVVGLTKNLLTELYARTLGVWAEHRLWHLGLTTFLFSTIVFKTPFSSPSRIVNHSPKFTPRTQGLVASASVVASLAFSVVFYALLSLGYTYIGSIGLGMCILGALFDTLPIAPMNGRDIYDWSIPIWAAQFILTLALLRCMVNNYLIIIILESLSLMARVDPACISIWMALRARDLVELRDTLTA